MKKTKSAANMSEEELQTKIDTWLHEPLNTKFIPAIVLIILTAFVAIALFLKKLDVDSFYMITQGNEILQSGFPKYNNFVFMEDYKIVIQQWLYCIILAVTDNLFGSAGLIIFGSLQAILLLKVIERKLYASIPDKFWSYLIAGISCLAVQGYYLTIRPENTTFILIILDCILLEKYQKTNKLRYLYMLPLMTLLEINLHASMWPFHFCILLAHAVPSIFKNHVADNSIKRNKHLFITIALMIASLFINPYGIDNITYVFNSLDTFNFIPIREQNSTAYLSVAGITMVVCIILLTLGLQTKKIKSTTLYICLGFMCLAVTSYHSAMFLLITLVFIASDYLADLNIKLKGIKASSTMKKDMWIIIMFMGLCVLVTIFSIVSNKNSDAIFKKESDVKNIVEYIKEKDPDNSEHILVIIDYGSQLIYNDIRNIFSDTRPEILNEKINGKENTMELVALLMYNKTPPTHEVKTIGEMLDYYDIQYIIDYKSTTAYMALDAYLGATDDYKVVEFQIPEGEKEKLILYERVTERTE